MGDVFYPHDRAGDAAVLAKNMWNNGVDRDEIADRLARRAYDKATIDRILDTLPQGVPVNIVVSVPRTSLGRVVLIACGLLVWGLGALIVAASRGLRAGPEAILVGLLAAAGGAALIRAGRT